MSEDAPVEGTPLIAPSNTDHPLYENIVEIDSSDFSANMGGSES